MADLTLINPSGTVVTLTDDPATVDFARHVFGKGAEADLRAAGYRDLEPGEAIPPQHWEAHAATPPTFADLAASGGVAVSNG